MIIDCHTHIGEPPAKRRVWNALFSNGEKLHMDMGDEIDMSIDNLLSDMDHQKIERAFVMSFPGWASNEHLADVVKKHSQRIRGFGYVDNPKLPTSVEQLEYCVESLGLKGLKLHPGMQMFEASDPAIFPLISKAVDLDVPILIHSFQWPDGYTHYSYPHHIDVLANKFPQAKIIVGHMGGLRFMDTISIGQRDNVLLEISFTLKMMEELHGTEFVNNFIKMVGVQNLVLGSDWAGERIRMSSPMKLIHRLDLTNEEKGLILGGNAERFVGS